MELDDPDLNDVVAALRRLDPDGERTAQVLRDTFDQLYDGVRTKRYSWEQLFKTEKTHFGTLIEINLQREFKFADGDKLDYQIAGHDVDAKYSQKMGSWMLPPEAVNQLCMVVTASDVDSSFSLGVVRAREEWLGKGQNRDAKRTLSAAGRPHIHWLTRDGDLPPNVLLHLSPSDIAAIFKPKGGTARISELFRRAPGKIVSRAAVCTAAAQLDPTRRLRGGKGGARGPLAAEGMVILSGAYDWQARAARQLGLPVPRRTEYVSAYVSPASPEWAGPIAVGKDGGSLVLMPVEPASATAFSTDWYSDSLG
ncbi:MULTISPECIES: NaeI family type II restriction endonuclease [Tsukamurella]|uniref:Restriction endonuclease n=1 Tax=Tsukamurella columbiensis TaxID=128509 RepID=A0ABX1LDL3_9ACTN|nr:MULTISPECIES: NaeI family type II restriction endonuclease [Tsukamurella]NMD56338.1 restriction endonuclease [Tsukamurella columbiensis]